MTKKLTFSNQTIEIPLWYTVSTFNYTKQDRKFCIFENTSDQSAIPHIPNHYILTYITKCQESKYHYNEEECEFAVFEENHAAFDKDHFHLFPTISYWKITFSNCLKDLLDSMNHIYKYGEFLYPEYETLNRWGSQKEAQAMKRAYKVYPPKSAESKPLANIFIKENKVMDLSTPEELYEHTEKHIIEAAKILADEAEGRSENISIDLTGAETEQARDTREALEAYLADQAEEASKESSNMVVVPSRPHTPLPEEKDDAVNLLKMIIPNFLLMLKDENMDNNIKKQTINMLKGFYDDKRIQNNSILNRILSCDSVIDLTTSVHKKEDKSPTPLNKKRKSPVKTKSPKKSPKITK